MRNMAIFGIGFVGGCLVLGYLLAIFIDQKVRAESALRTIFLYPYALSYIVTGFAWQWFLNPQLGLQKFMQDLGWTDFTFRLLIDRNLAIYTIVAAAIWHGAGLVMALVLAGLRGVDEDIWKAINVEGIPKWWAYLSIILPMLGPSFATCILLLAFGVIRNYDLVVAMTGGGPGSASLSWTICSSARMSASRAPAPLFSFSLSSPWPHPSGMHAIGRPVAPQPRRKGDRHVRSNHIYRPP
jgi:glucose/mannose transport system permease protein